MTIYDFSNYDKIVADGVNIHEVLLNGERVWYGLKSTSWNTSWNTSKSTSWNTSKSTSKSTTRT